MISVDHLSSLVLIAGLSGAGKSSALHTIADLGYFAIDNLPLPLFRDFLDLSKTSAEKFNKTCILLDLDTDEKVASFLEMRDELPGLVQLFFLDADNETILKRYSETRRPHPGFVATLDKSLEDTIAREREHFYDVKERANFVIDTSNKTIHDLRREVKAFIDSISPTHTKAARVNFLSFGFKRGLPRDCDLVVDVRFLPNPYFVPALRDRDGREKDVCDYVLETEEARTFLDKYTGLLDYLLPQYVVEGKSYVNIGVGCTGGKHRSVAIAEELARRITKGEFLVSVKHRDIS